MGPNIVPSDQTKKNIVVLVYLGSDILQNVNLECDKAPVRHPHCGQWVVTGIGRNDRLLILHFMDQSGRPKHGISHTLLIGG
jgi:hypothetical protein